MSKERQLPDVLKHDFVISDESVNRYGYRILTEGINLDGFERNPVCCVHHDTMSNVVGRWENMRKENGKLMGTVIFDRNDPEAIKLYWKYTDGFWHAVSLHIIPLEESELKEYVLPGQTRPTVTKSELLEVSLVIIPGQKNAVKLHKSDGNEYEPHLIGYSARTSQTAPETKEQLMAEIERQKKLSVESLIELHKTRGVVISDTEIPHMITLGMNNYDLVKNILEIRDVK